MTRRRFLERGTRTRWQAVGWQHGGRFWRALWKAGKLMRPVERGDTAYRETILGALPDDL